MSERIGIAVDRYTKEVCDILVAKGFARNRTAAFRLLVTLGLCQLAQIEKQLDDEDVMARGVQLARVVRQLLEGHNDSD